MWLLQNSRLGSASCFQQILPAVMLPPKGQNLLLNGWFRQGHGQAGLPLGLVLKQLLQMEGDGG